MKKRTMINIQTKKIMKHLLLLVCTFCTIAASAQKKWTLKACVEHALENNISVKQSENSLLTNDQDIIAAKGNFMPSLSMSGSQRLNLGNVEVFDGNFVDRTFHSTNLGINISQTIFNGFRNTNIYKQSLINKEANEEEYNRIKDNVALNVVNSYLNVLLNKENLIIAQAQFAFSTEQLEQVRELVAAGTQPQANVFDSEATLASDEQQLTVAQNNYTLALLSLSQVLQVPFESFGVEIIKLDTPSQALMYDDVQPILEHAFNNRSEIKVAEKNIESAELSRKISKSGFYPTLTFGYGLNAGANFSNLSKSNSFFQQINDNKGHSFSLNLNIPIFSRYQNKTNLAKSSIQVENRKLALDQAKLDLESNIQRAFMDAKAALKTYISSQKSVASRQLSFENAQQRYNIGALNAFDLEQNRVQLVNAQSSLVRAKYDFVFKTKVLDFYLGKSLVL
ncbi:TolC family protein [Flavobacteriaceae bacterium]|nr:TolC family protein [Flavobacteriaceae bacterium]